MAKKLSNKPVTVVVPVFNSTQAQVDMTKKALQSIYDTVQDRDLQVVIIDDASPLYTNLIEYASTYIKRGKNVGIAPNWNRGIKEALHEHVCIINSDIVLHEGCIKDLIETVDREEYAFAFPTPIECEEDKERRYVNRYQYGITYAPCIMSTKSTYEHLKENGQYYDENIVPCWFEDKDMWIRAQKASVSLISSTGAFVTHLGGGHQTVSLKSSKKAIFERNKAYYKQKHGL